MGSRGPKPKNLRSWLRGLQPFSLLCETDDGDKIVKVQRTSKGVGKWNELLRTLDSLGATRIEARGEEDDVLGVWETPAVVEAPGYVKEPDDTEGERLLKTFGHLLADAHKISVGELSRVITIQAQNFAEERKAFASTMQSMDRATQRMARTTSRLRIATEGDDGEEPETADNFVQELLTSALKGRAAEATAAASAPANGKGKES